MNKEIQKTLECYDLVAIEYAKKFIDEMNEKPFDRKMLELLTEKVTNLGMICDLGCGPGNIARYLHKIKNEVCGIDLSEKMIEQARILNPAIQFNQGNMLDLKMIKENYFGGIAAFYSIIHIPKILVLKALKEFHRILKKHGTLLITFHIGNEIKHLDEWLGKKINIDVSFFQTDEMKDFLIKAGFELGYVIEREPVKEVEVETRRAYIFVSK